MGLFDFLKPKKTDKELMFEKISNSIFPKGDKDIDACVDELLRILNNKISRAEAKDIVLKATFISRVSNGFPSERLHAHLKPYALHHFDQEQFIQFWVYLIGLHAAMIQDRKTPSEISWTGSQYTW